MAWRQEGFLPWSQFQLPANDRAVAADDAQHYAPSTKRRLARGFVFGAFSDHRRVRLK